MMVMDNDNGDNGVCVLSHKRLVNLRSLARALKIEMNNNFSMNDNCDICKRSVVDDTSAPKFKTLGHIALFCKR